MQRHGERAVLVTRLRDLCALSFTQLAQVLEVRFVNHTNGLYNMSRPKTRPDTTHDHGQQLASMSGTAQPSHIALLVVQEVLRVRTCAYAHASFFKFLRVTSSFCKFLQVSASFCKYLQVSASLYKFLQVSASFFKFH